MSMHSLCYILRTSTAHPRTHTPSPLTGERVCSCAGGCAPRETNQKQEGRADASAGKGMGRGGVANFSAFC
jgi:hypothetical protein